MDVKEKYEFAQTLVREAGAFLRQHLHDELQIEIKSDFTDLVTHLDKQVQEKMTEKIAARYPEDVVVGEENQQYHPIGQGAVWVIDPIDGTTNFIVQQTDFAVLLAYFENGVGQFGLIYDVMKNCLYHGGGSFDVYENTRLLPSAVVKPLSQGLIGMNAGLYAQKETNFRALADASLGMRWIGSAGLSFAHVLSQRLMLQVSYVHPWDYAAASILGKKLGYQLFNDKGEAPTFDGRECVLLVAKEQVEEVKRYLT